MMKKYFIIGLLTLCSGCTVSLSTPSIDNIKMAKLQLEQQKLQLEQQRLQYEFQRE